MVPKDELQHYIRMRNAREARGLYSPLRADYGGQPDGRGTDGHTEPHGGGQMHTVARIVLLALGGLAFLRMRWAYAAYVALALAWIPASAGFRLHAPPCEMSITAAGVALSLTKWAHIVLFGIFFLMTLRQFRRVTFRNAALAMLATLVMGLMIELTEGASGTGSCRMRDLFPDAAGALIAYAFVMAFRLLQSGKRDGRRDDSKAEIG